MRCHRFPDLSPQGQAGPEDTRLGKRGTVSLPGLPGGQAGLASHGRGGTSFLAWHSRDWPGLGRPAMKEGVESFHVQAPQDLLESPQ